MRKRRPPKRSNASPVIIIRAARPLHEAVTAKCRRAGVPVSTALRSLLVRWTNE